MSKTRSAKPRPKKQAAKSAAPARKSSPSKRAPRAKVEAEVEEEEIDLPPGAVLCRSCGKRPGRPTAILGQMTQAELCAQCTALRKERIRLNRAAARGLRSSRLF
jgi:NMD protein affecting ribosome stability and mRNA decay